ncbi:cytochrome c-550 PedF [Novispirillum sp. DQ9]|uniref:cytochrome c-550 PedF n=1 Tax=Novispirillum sp. DQ9 TaxID=3398612 RepID=UPI003C7C1731
MRLRLIAAAATAAATLVLAALPAGAHGDVVPQAVDVSALPPLGEEWTETNPYLEDPAVRQTAESVGSSAYNQNCARCHGLEVISGGIAPDLRFLPADEEGDHWFTSRVRSGAMRNGVTYMPSFEGILAQEALWAIRTYIVSQHQE